MADSPEAAQHFIFMCGPTTPTITDFPPNHTLLPKQHPARLCRFVLLSSEPCISISPSPSQHFVRHVDPCLAGAYEPAQTPLSPGIGSPVSIASGVTYGKLHGLQSRPPTCFAGAQAPPLCLSVLTLFNFFQLLGSGSRLFPLVLFRERSLLRTMPQDLQGGQPLLP